MPLHCEARVIRSGGAPLRRNAGDEPATDVNGYVVVLAASIDEAAEIAKDCPLLKEGGTVEARPLFPRSEHDHLRSR
jgi:hypothetical protein